MKRPPEKYVVSIDEVRFGAFLPVIVVRQLHEENPPIEEDFNPWSEKERVI